MYFQNTYSLFSFIKPQKCNLFYFELLEFIEIFKVV